jgi:hypothetical protein
MKKLEKLFAGRTLTAELGKAGTYNHQSMVISASEQNGTHVFKITKYSNRGHESEQTIVLENVLNTMKAFNPKATAWKVSKKPKAVKAPKVKAVKKAEPVVMAAVKKGRA